ncbi:MAG: hypothetical protein AB7Q97_10390 [Gammaproteobacteria bacterium]
MNRHPRHRERSEAIHAASISARPHGLPRPLRGLSMNRTPSLRGAKRRSNPRAAGAIEAAWVASRALATTKGRFMAAIGRTQVRLGLATTLRFVDGGSTPRYRKEAT